MTALFPNFLRDHSEYARAQAYWASVWATTPVFERMIGEWRTDWFGHQPINDGNPIFSAISGRAEKGIRVIQYEATNDGLELDFWLDTFGGAATDPGTVRELVITCALSIESAQLARNLMASWIIGEIEVASSCNLSLGFKTIRAVRPRWRDTTLESGSDFSSQAA
jgi:hypothetical protein